MEYTITNIDWDVDHPAEYELLPDTMKVQVPEDVKEPEDIDEYISDKITEETGFCHKGFATTPEVY